MIELFGMLLVLALLAALILPWVNLVSINQTRRELWQLREELQEGRRRQQEAVRTPERSAENSELPQSESGTAGEKPVVPPAKAAVPPPLQAKAPAPQRVAVEAAASRPRAQSELGQSELEQPELKRPDAVEEASEPQDWFGKAAVWVGSIALLMAGFFMIKYSIESGLLTPAVRLWLTTGFGALLCGVGFWIGLRAVDRGNARIGQALSGAGIACLYFAAYAAVHLYEFLSPGQGFAAMLAVTVLAVGLSLRNGAPVAMMGLVGGFLTPWLMDTGTNDTVMLFSYLFLLFCGAQFLCARWCCLASGCGPYCRRLTMRT